MKTMNKVLAICFAVISIMAFYGAAFCGKPWHYVTFALCAFISLVCFLDSNRPDETGLSTR